MVPAPFIVTAICEQVDDIPTDSFHGNFYAVPDPDGDQYQIWLVNTRHQPYFALCLPKEGVVTIEKAKVILN